jgi:hypothetical protein
MTPSTQPGSPAPDFAALWENARQLHPIYVELAREFVIDVPACAALSEPTDAPDQDTVQQALQWLNEMDDRIQVHQLRQFLQTSSMVDADGLAALIQHYLWNPAHSDISRDKIDFLLVQYFSQKAPTELDDGGADLAYVSQELEPLLGKVELKAPVWLNALDRVLDAARRCQSLDELLHGGVLEQGRKAKAQAGELFYMPIALVAFTRFGYLMRRVFFRLMLTDLNNILDGLTKLDERGVETIDCRRAQFSAQEPIVRLRMICQSWKVMFQAEYSSGQPLRMLVDLRASVDAALASDSADEGGEKAFERTAAAKAASAPKARAAAATASANGAKGTGASGKTTSAPPAVANDDPPEFEISAAPAEWSVEDESQPREKK